MRTRFLETQLMVGVRAEINSRILGAEAPGWQGAEALEYQEFQTLPQRRQAGWIGALNVKLFLRAPFVQISTRHWAWSRIFSHCSPGSSLVTTTLLLPNGLNTRQSIVAIVLPLFPFEDPVGCGHDVSRREAVFIDQFQVGTGFGKKIPDADALHGQG